MRRLVSALVQALEQGQSPVLAVVCGVRGSAPAGPGSAMLLLPGGRSLGSVGGGAVEEAARRAGEALFSGPGDPAPESGWSRAVRLDLRLDQEQAAGLGMACGGAVSVLISAVPAGSESLALFRTALALAREGQPCALVTECGTGSAARVCRRLAGPDGRVLAGPGWPAVGQADSPTGGPTAALPLAGSLPAEAGFAPAPADAHFVEPLAPLPGLFVFGAGHVGQAVARLAAGLSFRITVVDDRAEFADPARFPPEALVLVEHPAAACARLPIGPQDFVLILTRGHLLDREVLSQALATPARYIGMIGSRSKRAAVFGELALQGFGPADLARVRCPVGLAIGARTVEEIAVSIAAELVAELRGATPPLRP